MGGKPVSTKIPAVVTVELAENFKVTETTIFNAVTRDFLVNKLGNSNHQILLKFKEAYTVTNTLPVEKKAKFFTYTLPFEKNHATY